MSPPIEYTDSICVEGIGNIPTKNTQLTIEYWEDLFSKYSTIPEMFNNKGNGAQSPERPAISPLALHLGIFGSSYKGPNNILSGTK